MLLSLLTVKMPITDADLIRALACKALVGLSRCGAVRQIIGKLPLFSGGQLQQLMKEPVLQDKRSEHVRFCRYAAELIERVSGRPLLIGTDASLARLQRASVVAQSRITFPEKELLMLIRNHLVAKGLLDTAGALTREAQLPSAALLAPFSHPCASPYPALAGGLLSSSSAALPRTPRLANGVAAHLSTHAGQSLAASSASASVLPQPHPSSSAAAAPPHGQGLPLVGRILFSRERPGCSPPECAGRKPRVLRQKSDHGAFIQVGVRI